MLITANGSKLFTSHSQYFGSCSACIPNSLEDTLWMMKKAIYLVKIDDLGDPDIHQLVKEFSVDQNWEPDGVGNMSLFTFFSHRAQNGLQAIKPSCFATSGIWSKRVSELPADGQLLQFLNSSCSNYPGGSLEQFGKRNILVILKKLFPAREPAGQRTECPSDHQRMVATIQQRRINGSL